MSNAVAISDPRPQLVAGARPTAIVPRTMEEAYRLATAVCTAGMAPYGIDTPEKALIAIMHGLEVGLTPMMAMQRIAVVNGRPTIWGDAAIGLVRASGLCEWIKEWVDGSGDARAAVCEAKRRGEPGTIKRNFSVADAKTAKLWGKSGPKGPTPWVTMPDRMLQMRARGFCLRDGFADVLGGLYIREEIDDELPRQHGHPAPPAPPAPPIKEAAPEPPAPQQSPSNALFDFDGFRDALDSAQSLDELNEKFTGLTKMVALPEDLAECSAILHEITARFWVNEE